MTDKTNAIIIESRSFDLDKVLSEIGSGFRAVIKRKEPTWCDGVIDTIELDPEEPISMDFLRREYGGRKLQIVIQDAKGDYVTMRTVKFPDPPRSEGRDMVRDGHGPGNAAQAQQSIGGGGSFADLKSIFELMIGAQKEQTQTILGAMSSRLDAIERRPATTAAAAPQTTPGRPLSAIKESLAAIKEIETLKAEMGFTQQQDHAPQENSLNKALDKFIDLQLEAEQAKIRRDIARSNQEAPGRPALPPASTYTPPGAQTPAQRPADAQAMIAGLSDIELAAHVKTRLENMTPEQRDHLMEQFADQFDFEEYEDDEEPEQLQPDTVLTDNTPNTVVNFPQVTVIDDQDGGPLGSSAPDTTT